MLLRNVLHLRGHHLESLEFELPLVVPLTCGAATVEATDEDGVYRLVLERRVRADALALRTDSGVRLADSSEEIPLVEVPPEAIEGPETATDIAAALSFLTDRPLDVSWAPDRDALMPETSDDEQLLRSFGTDGVLHQLEGRLSARTFHERVTPELVAALLPKSVGLLLYVDALRQRSNRVRYRELWLVLESAFGLEGRDLSKAIARYPPAVQLGFTEDELEDLRSFRGRASHAASRAGITELRRITAGTADREGRLKTLVERIVVTKKMWGSPSQGYEELVQLKGWVARDPSV